MADAIEIDLITIAIEICNKDAFKTEVFSGMYRDHETPEECKRRWDEKVEITATSLLEDYPHLVQHQQEAVIGAVFSIALRMLIWIEFYVGTFNFTRDFCIEFLEGPLFTSKGIIDPLRVQTKMSLQEISNLQKFQLASFDCQLTAIAGSFNNLNADEKNLVFNESDSDLIDQPNIIKFWSYHCMGELDLFKGTVKTEHFRLITAVTSGSKLAVNYCLDRTRSKQNSLLDTVVSLFRHRVNTDLSSDEDSNLAGDWIVFRNKRFSYSEECWIPDIFYADIFYSLLSEMSESQKIRFWKQVFDSRYTKSDDRITALLYAEVFDYLLYWPYQEMFMELLKFSWEYLSSGVFSFILLKIADRIEPRRGKFRYGEERFFDYRKMLMETWTATPCITKRKLFRKRDENTAALLKSLYYLKGFTESDRTNIRSIVESVSDNMRLYFILSDGGRSISAFHLKNRRPDLFDELCSLCLSTPEQVHEYKLSVILIEAVKINILGFIQNEMWDSAEQILRWSDCPLTEEDILFLKSKLIRCADGTTTCINLWKINSNAADDFIRWCCVPPEQILKLKTDLICCKIGMKACREFCVTNSEIADSFLSWCLPPERHFEYKIILMHCLETVCACTKYVLIDNTPELADRLIRWCLPERKIIECKKHLGHNKLEIFPKFKSTFEGIENCTHDEFPDRIFEWMPEPDDGIESGGDETLAQKSKHLFASRIFSWCFDSDPEEINKFKEGYLKKSKREILFKCIELNNWALADQYLFWLGLDRIDVRKTKTEQICGDAETGDLFSDLMCRKENDPRFTATGGKQRTIERFIHWFLVDGLTDVAVLIKKMERYSEDNIVKNIIQKLKSSNEIEVIKELLTA